MLSKVGPGVFPWREIHEGAFVTHFPSAEDGLQVYLKYIKGKSGEGQADPVTFFIFHDLCSYHGRFLNMVEWFKIHAPHISFVLMDFVGHGLSSGTRGHLGEFQHLVADALQAFKLLEKGEKERWVALGHGVGALVLLDLMNQFDDMIKTKIDRLVLSNFALNFSSPLLRAQEQIVENISGLNDLMARTRLTEIYLASDMLSSTREQTAYLEDPLIVRKPTYHTLINVKLKAKSIYQNSYFLDKPLLVLESHGPYLQEKGIESFCKGVNKALLTQKKYSHLKHDLYNEKERTVVFNDIVKWVLE